VGLLLQMVDVVSDLAWRWLLTDEDTGSALADHTVSLDPDDADLAAFSDLYRYLRDNAVPDRRVPSEIALVARVGTWIGREVLGSSVGQAIVAAAPVTVRVQVPPRAEFMVFRPLELAHVGGVPLASRGDVTLVFDFPGTTGPKAPVADRLRMLAVFSLPTSTSALALRRERYELSHLIRRLAARERRVVELRVLQYGVTRERLAEIVESEDGWDLLHLSGHGGAGTFLLEKADGAPDPVTTPDLVGLLRPMRRRLKLAVVSACQSAAATTGETLRWLRLDEKAEELDEQATREAGPALPGIAPELVRRLDCAVVAMRYPVTDDFAIDLAHGLYKRLLSHGRALDVAVHRAVAEAAGPSPTAARPAISVATPAVFGTRATGLSLVPPRGVPVLDPQDERMAGFPPEPSRFVGRAQAMAQASAALAPESGQTAVVLYGMAGAGKTACALELAYQHQNAFSALAFWQAPLRDEEFGRALADLALALENQLAEYGFAMVDKIVTREQLERFLPRLRALLQRAGLLLVLDNLETLLTADGTWRDPRWPLLISALTEHRGESRVVLTSRIPPARLPDALLLPVNALSLDETAALSRELPHLRALLHADAGPLRGHQAEEDRALVRRVLHVVQGHPKLLELADAAARDPGQLTAHLDAAELAGPDEGTLRAFLNTGTSDLDPDQFLDVLAEWTHDTLATLPRAGVLLLRMLCCLEEDDRIALVVKDNWNDVWQRLDTPGEAPDLDAVIELLAAAALVHIEPSGGYADEDNNALARYRVHPGVAEAIHATTEASIRTAVDIELGAYWDTLAQTAMQQESNEAGRIIVYAGLAAAPYFLRHHYWDTASTLLEDAMYRDYSPRTLQKVIPLLRKIADATHSPKDLGVLARAVRHIDPTEAERLIRDALRQALDDRNHRLASSVTGELTELLHDTGRLREALVAAEQKPSYTRQAGLGPWTQLADRISQLRILAALGEHQRVLAEAAHLRQTMDHLPERFDDSEIIQPWKARESILATGHISARALGRWQECLTLNAEILACQQHRDAGPLDLADTRFNDSGPLLELGRLAEAEKAAVAYQRTAEQHHDVARLAQAFSARATVEARRGRPETAISLGGIALRYAYTQSDPRIIAIGHYNLASHLGKRRIDLQGRRVHRVAAALIYQLTGMAHELVASIEALALESVGDDETERPPTIQEIIEHAERTEGVHLTELLATLAPHEQVVEDALAGILLAAQWSPFINAVVDAASGDQAVGDNLALALDEMAGSENRGELADVLGRIIAGDRDPELRVGLDPIDTAIVDTVLERLVTRSSR